MDTGSINTLCLFFSTDRAGKDCLELGPKPPFLENGNLSDLDVVCQGVEYLLLLLDNLAYFFDPSFNPHHLHSIYDGGRIAPVREKYRQTNDILKRRQSASDARKQKLKAIWNCLFCGCSNCSVGEAPLPQLADIEDTCLNWQILKIRVVKMNLKHHVEI